MNKNIKDEDISREQALNRIGKYVALTAVGTFLILNPQRSQSQSVPPPSAEDNSFLDFVDD